MKTNTTNSEPIINSGRDTTPPDMLVFAGIAPVPLVFVTAAELLG
jgi:hypothetical protein